MSSKKKSISSILEENGNGTTPEHPHNAYHQSEEELLDLYDPQYHHTTAGGSTKSSTLLSSGDSNNHINLHDLRSTSTDIDGGAGFGHSSLTTTQHDSVHRRSVGSTKASESGGGSMYNNNQAIISSLEEELDGMQGTIDVLTMGLEQSEQEKVSLTKQLSEQMENNEKLARLAERVAELEEENKNLRDELSILTQYGELPTKNKEDEQKKKNVSSLLGNGVLPEEKEDDPSLEAADYKARYFQERNARRRRELEFVANEEKMLMWLGCRSVQVAHISQLFASSVERNHEYERLVDRLCKIDGLTPATTNDTGANGSGTHIIQQQPQKKSWPLQKIRPSTTSVAPQPQHHSNVIVSRKLAVQKKQTGVPAPAPVRWKM